MDAALNTRMGADIESRISSALSLFKLSNIEKLLSGMLDNMPNEHPINYFLVIFHAIIILL